MSVKNIVAGSYVVFKDVDAAINETRSRHGFNYSMEREVKRLQGVKLKVTDVTRNQIYCEGLSNHCWSVFSFELVDERDFKTTDGWVVGDKVKRYRSFTSTFVEGEVHVIKQISPCGKYIKVEGHNRIVPVKFFEKSLEPIAKAGDKVKSTLTGKVYTVHDVSACGTKFRKVGYLGQGMVTLEHFEVVNDASAPPVLTDFSEPPLEGGRKVGDNPHGCGLVANTEPKPVPKTDPTSTKPEIKGEVKPELVVGLIMAGHSVEYLSCGLWVEVPTSRMTIDMMKRLTFRMKPLTFDYYGQDLPKPIDVDAHTATPVYGVTLNNGKIYPCSLGVARNNKRKGVGLYWATEADAQTVFDTIYKPFKDIK